jgi:Cys-rich repeat protein
MTPYPGGMSVASLICRSAGAGAVALGLAACGGGDNAGTLFETRGETGATLDPGSTGEADTGEGPSSTADSTTGAADDEDTGLDDGLGETGDDGCQSSADCQDPAATVCDAESGECVGCTADDDPCSLGSYCDADQKTCVPGCLSDMHCGGELLCDVDNNQCTGCIQDGDCPAGTLCNAGTCEAGCTAMHPCLPGLACCDGDCVDIDTDLDHCGGCGAACVLDNAQGICDAGDCDLDQCDQGFNDCNQNHADGCETQGMCACEPNAVQICYTGPPGTEGVGVCQAGTQTCNGAGTGWGPCLNQVLPSPEICGSGQDENCNAEIDENPDNDLDGWGVCDGDCCDSVGPGCLNPALVNPGAFEYPGNMVDDDCDGTVDNVLPACDAGLASNSADPNDYARAINLCQFTTLNPPLPDRIWGVISSSFTRANGAGVPNANSRSLRAQFGPNNPALHGDRLAVLSTGYAAASGQTNPNFAHFQTGQNMQTSSGFPADWLAANGGTLPAAPGCPTATGNSALDPVMLTLQVRAPTNAKSFTVKMYFFSAEYPEWICTPYNDFFVTLVDAPGAEVPNPPDKNIAVYQDGNTLWPVGVNIVHAAPGLFTQCINHQITYATGATCTGPQGFYNGCLSTDGLTNTGFHGTSNAICANNIPRGGGTSWLTMSGNVEPGEVTTLRFAIWDTGDWQYDSVVLLDDFQWNVDPSAPGVTPQ